MAAVLVFLFSAVTVLHQTACQTIDSVLRIQFIRYENVDGKLANGFFCQSDFDGRRTGYCDPIFNFEVMREGGHGEALFNYKQADHFNPGKVFNFSTVIGKMVNPLNLDVQMQHPRNIFLKVTVDDYDPSGKNKPMDIFVHMIQPTLKRANVTLTSPATKHSLAINYGFSCKAGYYGSMCAKYCIGKNDDTHGHFVCSPEGEKVCLDGWTNVDSDCKVPAWCIWC